MDAFFIKLPNGTLTPASLNDTALLSKIKVGQPVRLTFTRVRNYQFHKKFMALMNFAFDYWEPPEGAIGEKNFDRFRKDVIILAGFYEQTVRLNGEIRTEAKSIAFANMSEDEFEELYTKCVDVIVSKILPSQFDGAMLKELVEFVESFE